MITVTMQTAPYTAKTLQKYGFSRLWAFDKLALNNIIKAKLAIVEITVTEPDKNNPKVTLITEQIAIGIYAPATRFAELLKDIGFF